MHSCLFSVPPSLSWVMVLELIVALCGTEASSVDGPFFSALIKWLILYCQTWREGWGQRWRQTDRQREGVCRDRNYVDDKNINQIISKKTNKHSYQVLEQCRLCGRLAKSVCDNSKYGGQTMGLTMGHSRKIRRALRPRGSTLKHAKSPFSF